MEKILIIAIILGGIGAALAILAAGLPPIHRKEERRSYWRHVLIHLCFLILAITAAIVITKVIE